MEHSKQQRTPFGQPALSFLGSVVLCPFIDSFDGQSVLHAVFKSGALRDWRVNGGAWGG